MTSLKILELFLRHSKNITEFSKNKSLKTQILRKKSCFDQILFENLQFLENEAK